LQAAESALAANRLTTPVGDNAVERFRAVLELEPGNAAAQDGLTRVAEKYVSMARRSASRGDHANAESLLAKAESLEPDVPGLDSARQLIADSRQERSDATSRTQDLVKKMRIEGLLGGAEVAMADGNYTEPAGTNALERYHAVLELEPQNRDALAGLRQLSTRLIAKAEASAQAGKLDEAKHFLELADDATPGNPAVAAARKKL
jgi:tetratricopeptide (TPR) repeat protein